MSGILSYRIYYVWKRNLVSYRRFAIPTFIASLGEPLLYLVAMGIGMGSYMGLVNGMPYLNFLAPGLLVSTAMFAATYECTFGAYVRMTIEKIYNAMIITPLNVEEVIAGEILWGITRSVFSGIIMLIVLTFFGLADFKTYLFMPLLWIAIGFYFSSLGIIVSAIAPNFDFFTYYFELFITPMFFFSGIFFPLDNMPDIVKLIANFLPLTYAVDIARQFMITGVNKKIILDFTALLIPATVFFFWALYKMKRRLIR